MSGEYPRSGGQGDEQDPMRFWIEQVSQTMGAPGRTPDTPPPADSVEHHLYNALMKEVVYGVPQNSYFAVEPGGRTRFTDPATGMPLSAGEVPPSIVADRMLREGINYISMEGRRLQVQHVTYDFGPNGGRPFTYSEANVTRIAKTLGRKGGVLYIDPPLEELSGEAKHTGLPTDVNDTMQTMLNTVATRVLYGFLTDGHTVGRIDDEIREILPVIGEHMGPAMQRFAEQIRGTGVEIRLLGMDRSKEPSQLLREIRREISEAAQSPEGNGVEARVERVRSTLTLRNYTEWHLLGEVGADLAQRNQQRKRVREAAIFTSERYANLTGKLDGCAVRVDSVGAPGAGQLRLCGQRGFVDPADFLKIFRQEELL